MVAWLLNSPVCMVDAPQVIVYLELLRVLICFDGYLEK